MAQPNYSNILPDMIISLMQIDLPFDPTKNIKGASPIPRINPTKTTKDADSIPRAGSM